MKTTILWDHDGVLVETEPWYFEATRLAIKELGVDLRKADYIADMAYGISAWERARAIGITEEDITRHKRLRNQRYQEFLRVENIDIEGVESILAALAATYSMAIVTTSKKEDFELIHRGRGICKYMSFVLANGDYARSKPHPDPYLMALEKFGVTKEECVAIEDSERGLRSAVAAGIDCVVVANSFVKGQDFRDATDRIDSLSELASLLEQM